MESSVAVLEQIARTTATSMERIERRFDAIERRFDAFERRLDALAADQRADFRWQLGISLGGFGALLGVMAHGFHWL
jgi:hypothetical protein